MTKAEQREAAELLRRYIEATSWIEHRDEPAVANRFFDDIHQVYKRLRSSQDGRQGIAELLNAGSEQLHLLAATHTLAWSPEEAVPVLESIERGAGLTALSAKYTLQAFRAGKLDLDW